MPAVDLENTFHDGFTRSKKPEQFTLLPDPAPAPRYVPLISTDDHLVEPPDMFIGRLTKKYAELAPRVIDIDDGQAWLYNEKINPQIGLAAVAGRPIEECSFEPMRFDEMRRAAWDVHARVRDMDLDGVLASVNFPSALQGFCGHKLQLGVSDVDLALAVTRASNDWHLEAWANEYPDRLIPCQIPWLLDPDLAADEIRRNAGRGFKAVSFSENPQSLGLPSIHSGYWDPFLQACEETETVVCLHVGSSGTTPATSTDAPNDCIAVLFFGSALFAAVDWLFSLVPVRFPRIKICLSEGGIGWVAGLLDRLDHVSRYQSIYGTWDGVEPSPSDVLRRNFWFCSLEDKSAFASIDRIGVENVTIETDYPHLDGTWPDSQRIVWSQIGDLPDETIQRIAWRNAAELFRHEVSPLIIAGPQSW